MRRCLDKVKDWVIDSRDRLGADVRVAAKDITKEGGRPLHLTAYAVQEIHDPKVFFNNLFFFSTGEQARSRCGVMVACEFPVPSNHVLE